MQVNKVNLVHSCSGLGFILVCVQTVELFIANHSGFSFGSTALWWAVDVFVLLICLYGTFLLVPKSQYFCMYSLTFYLAYILISFVRGIVVVENYWDWKALIANGLALLLPSVAYFSSSVSVYGIFLRFYLFLGLPLLGILAPLMSTGAWGYYLAPISLWIIFFPFLPRFISAISMLLLLFVFGTDLGARSALIKILITFLLAVCFYFRALIPHAILSLGRYTLLVAPIIFFCLAVSGTFNIFKIDEYIQGEYVQTKVNQEGEEVEEQLLVDTRTGLYIEVLYSADYLNSWVFGRSPARGNLSARFGDDDLSGRGERRSNEVTILNVFTWTGVLGVVLYFFMFFFASGLAVNKSQSYICKLIGLYIAFRWAYSWVEDFTSFNSGYMCLFVMMGLCYSKEFRSMTDEEVKSWVKRVFRFPGFRFRPAI